MKNNKNLFGKKIEELKKDVFYRQRFDACPHFMAFIGEAHTSITNNSKYPYGQRSAYCRFSNNRGDWYHSNSQLKNTANILIDLLRKNSKLATKIKKETESKTKSFYEQCNNLTINFLENLTNEELLEEYLKLKGLYLQKLFVSALIDGFSLATDELLYEKIKSLRNIDTNDVFEKLTAHTFISFLQEEGLDLLKLKKEIIKKPSKKEDLISNHQKKYFWIQNNYIDDNILPLEFFRERLNKIDESEIDSKIEEINNLIKNHKEEKENLFKDLNINKETRKQFEFTDTLNYLQDERKKSTFFATHYFSLFLEELSKRTGFDKNNLKYSVPDEFEDILNGKIQEEELKNRVNGCIVLWYEDEYQLITDKDKIDILDSLTDSKKEDLELIKGLVASNGIISGTVKIVESVKDIDKVDVNDVLVSVMTRPDYLPAMKKASAFVTDEGGITCHAAIMARELKKPCIIRTKIATQVLKDGDLVEVDANKGVVKILKRA